MSTYYLGRQAHISQPRISELERAEIQDQITLKTLRAIAESLGCQLEYIFIPIEPIPEFLKRKAYKKAQEKMNYISHHMSLEDQKPLPEDQKKQIDMMVQEYLKNPKKIWS